MISQSTISVPDAYLSAVQFVVNYDLNAFFANGNGHFDIRELNRLADELERWDIHITNEQSFKLTVSERIFRELRSLEAGTMSLKELQNLIEVLETLENMTVGINFWKSQNVYFSMIKSYRAGEWVFSNDDWEDAFRRLGGLLRVRTM